MSASSDDELDELDDGEDEEPEAPRQHSDGPTAPSELGDADLDLLASLNAAGLFLPISCMHLHSVLCCMVHEDFFHSPKCA